MAVDQQQILPAPVGEDPLDEVLPQLRIVENAKRKKEPSRLLFSTGSRVFQALDPSIKRYAQTKRLLARRSLGALKRLRDFAGAGSFPSQ